MFNDSVYSEWREKRINFLVEHFGEKFFKGKKILELGCGYGHISNYFHGLGAKASCSDVRVGNIEFAQKQFPHLESRVVDINTEWPYKENEFDIIIHFGVLYHLDCDLLEHFKKLERSTKKWLLLETEVVDSDDPQKCLRVKEKDQRDQSKSGFGVRPSPAMVEKLLSDVGFRSQMQKSSELNCHVGWYDWTPMNDGSWTKKRPGSSSASVPKDGVRRFWICEK